MAAAAHRLTVIPTGETLEVEAGQTILEACLRAGVWLPYACGHGRCGTCKIDVVDGEIDQGDASSFALMDFERDEGKALACCAKLRSDVSIDAEIEEDEDAENHPPRSLTARVASISDLTPTIREITLALPGDADFEFQAGQYVNLHVPGVDEPRAFSIASSPSDPSVVKLQVRRVDGGRATSYLHDELTVGDELRLDGPCGRFFVRASRHAPRIFVAGGSGLSSLEAMLIERLEKGCTVPTTLIQGARTTAELYHRELFEALAAEYPHFTYLPAISGAEPDAPLPTGAHRGFAHEAMERAFAGRFAGHTAYLCGPPPMVEACIRSLMKGRLFEKDIFTERFVTQGDGAEALAKSPLFKRI